MTKLTHPCPGQKITQLFGANPQLYAQFGLAGHNGIDYGCAVGTPILAVAPGYVIFSNVSGAYGLLVKVQHPCFIGYYGHFSNSLVGYGLEVEAGDTIGYSGGAVGDPNAGNSTGPHLHFEMRPAYGGLPQYGGAIDPLPYIAGEDGNVQFRALTTASSLTVRSGAGSEYPVTSTQPKYLSYNTFVVVFRIENNYAEIGPGRWVSVKYLKKV